MEKTISERLFEQFCDENCIRWRRVSTSTQPTPDYDIFLGCRLFNLKKIVAEVKEIDVAAETAEAARQIDASGFSVVNMVPGDRVRNKIRRASRQIRLRTKGKYPGLLVLFEDSILVRYLDPYQVRVAMHGLDQLVIGVPEDMTKSPYILDRKRGPKRQLTEDNNTSISAVGTLLLDQQKKLQLTIFHNRHAEVPLNLREFAKLRIPQFVLEEDVPGIIPQWKAVS